MAGAAEITIAREDPRADDIVQMVGELDHYLTSLYPADSNHLTDLAELSWPPIAFFVARRGQAALGSGALVPRGDYGEIKRLYVRPTARGFGIGRLILAAIEQQATAMRLGWLRLETGCRQEEALRLFKSAGFSQCAPFGTYPLGDPWSVFMEKPLWRQ
jgi:putative acetyltransferase